MNQVIRIGSAAVLAMGLGVLGASSEMQWTLVEKPSLPVSVVASFYLDEGVTEISLGIRNDGSDQIMIAWDRCSLILPGGRSERIIHTGVKYAEKEMPQSPTPIPPNAYIAETIWPSSRVEWSGAHWRRDPILVRPDDMIALYLVWQDSRREHQGRWAWVAPASVADFDMQPEMNRISAKPGSVLSVALNLSREGGTPSPIQVSLGSLPRGVEASFEPNPLTGSRGTLTIQIGTAASVGTHAISLLATRGSIVKETSVELVVLQPVFNMAVSHAKLYLWPDDADEVRITFHRDTAFTQPIHLEVRGLPPGVRAVFSPNPVAGDHATLHISTDSSVATKVHNLRIRATAGPVTKEASLALDVIPPGVLYILLLGALGILLGGVLLLILAIK